MPLIYITGISGSGKTTVGEQLSQRGFESYDVDNDGFAAHYNQKTGKKVVQTVRTKEWHDRHEWKISIPKVKKLKRKAEVKPIFLCGVASNDNEVWNLFDTIIALTVDEKTLINRLADRKNNEFGKSEDELQMVLGWQKYAREEYQKLGAQIIDSTEPLDSVVNKVLHISRVSQPG